MTGHYILPCGFFYLLFISLFSSPNLSRRRLHVYHASTHGEALVRIKDAGLKRAAGSSLKIQEPKNRHCASSHITQICRAVSSQLRHVSRIGTKLVKGQYLLHMAWQYGKLPPTKGWDRFTSLPPCKFQDVSRLGSIAAWHSSSSREPNFAALNRGRHVYAAGRPSRLALAHILVSYSQHMPQWQRYSSSKLCGGAQVANFLATFLRPLFSAIRVQHISDLHSAFALKARCVVVL